MLTSFFFFARSMDSLNRLVKFAQRNKHVQESIEIVEKAFLRYKIENTCISYNGGKDCTAILHLVHSVANKICLNNNDDRLLAFYAQLPNHFEEELKFVNESVNKYNLKLLQYSSNSLKNSLFQLKTDNPQIEAIFIGTRKDDLKPTTRMDVYTPTDKDWPKFMRINPILDWSYAQVWEFIRELEIPYCDLYNQGYSSLGTKSDTSKNSSLIRFNEKGEPYYLPAWNLTKSHEERLSRSSSLDVGNKATHLQ